MGPTINSRNVWRTPYFFLEESFQEDGSIHYYLDGIHFSGNLEKREDNILYLKYIVTRIYTILNSLKDEDILLRLDQNKEP